MLTNESMHVNTIQIKLEKEYSAGEGQSNMRHFLGSIYLVSVNKFSKIISWAFIS